MADNTLIDPLVSIIIPVHNAETFLSECLESAIHQTMREIELICVENGSTDNSEQILENYGEQDPRIQIIHLQQPNAAAARNTGLLNASGEYVLFLDSDDYIDASLSAKAYKRITDEQADICLFNSTRYNYIEKTVVDGSASLNTALLPSTEPFTPKTIADTIFQITSSDCWSKMYKRDFLKRINASFPEDLHIAEDSVFVYSCMCQAETICSLNENLITNRRGQDSNMMTRCDEFSQDMFTSLSYIHDNLSDNGILENFATSFSKITNSSLETMMMSFTSGEAAKQLFSVIKNDGLKRLGLDQSVIATDQTSFLSKVLQSNDLDNYLLSELHRTRDALRDARIDVQSLENSASFRIGRKLTALPRIIRSKILHR